MYRYFLLVFAIFLLAGCAAPSADTPLFVMYQDQETIKDPASVATIITRLGIEIDGVKPSAKTHCKSSGNLKEELWAFDVLPGEHELKLTYRPQ